MTDLIKWFMRDEGVTITEPVPYPVNKFTIYWEYIKMEVAQENIFFGKFRRLIEKWDPESPIL